MATTSIAVTMGFEAAHRLPMVPPGHKCGRLHGHSYKLTLTLCGELDPTLGWIMDFADVRACAAPMLAQLDHHYLNEIPGLENPTSERICQWIWQQLKPKLPLLQQVEISETCTSRCRYSEPARSAVT